MTLAVLLLPGAAWAPPAETATLTMVSDPGDYIGQGQTWSYDTAAGDVISATATGNRSTVNVAVTGFNETWCFEQHCEGGDPALRGTLAIHNPPTPEPLDLGLTVAGDGTVSRVTGRATVQGTVTCSEPVTVDLGGTLTRVKKKTILTGSLNGEVACTPGRRSHGRRSRPRTAPPRSGRAAPRPR